MTIKRFSKHLSADQLTAAFLSLSKRETVCLLDSCGVSQPGSRFLLAGIAPVENFEISDQSATETLEFLAEKISQPDLFSIFTIAYDFGLKLENIVPREKKFNLTCEPDVSIHLFDALAVFDYQENSAFLLGNEKKFAELERRIFSCDFEKIIREFETPVHQSKVYSNYNKPEYLANIEQIKELIRAGATYQTNLTQQFRAELAPDLSARKIFWRLRKNHPAPFAAFVQRKNSTVISASPERFLSVQNSQTENKNPIITVSPIKGTRRRGVNLDEDLQLYQELFNSEKDRAENVMIVDLLRNDIGKICEFGEVFVENLCEIETHPSLFHLVSTVRGILKPNVNFSEIIKAVFPCGSITGAPKINTMRIIDNLETAARGLSMGAIGFSNAANSIFNSKNSETLNSQLSALNLLDLSVAIRTMTVRGNEAVFNVGGGIVIDSIAEDEYEETLIKAIALFDAINADF